eukprot:s621_g2.t1
MLRTLVSFVALSRSSFAKTDIFAYLNCEGHKSWQGFRKALGLTVSASNVSGVLDLSGPENRQDLAELASFADTLLVEHFASVEIGNFVSVLSEPGLTRNKQRAQDCVYGVVAALYIRGQELLTQGDVDAAAADWEMALQFLGKELGLDFMESTEWPRSSNILLSLAKLQGSPVTVSPTAPFQRASQAPPAVDTLKAWKEVKHPPLEQSSVKLQERKPEVVVYGYHPVLIEPVSALWSLQALRLHWIGVSDRDCAFFKLCHKRTPERPVPARLRYKIYMSEADVAEVEHAYREFWDAETRSGLLADLLICMELRDAYFLWKVARSMQHTVATIYYPGIIFMQDEAMSDYASKVLLHQFEELSSHDVLRQGGLHRTSGTVAMIAQSPYLAASIEYHTGRQIATVRPLANYLDVKYRPNSSTILVLCARTRLMMSHSCRGLFREGQHRLKRGLHLRLPPGDRDVVHGYSFEEVARFSATVLIPWNIAVTTFHELYAMNMPLFVPDCLWLARLWPKQMTSYGRSHPNLHQQLRPSPRGSSHPTPYPSLDHLEDFPTMLYWAHGYAFLEMPGVQTFVSIPQLLWSLNSGAYDLEKMSQEMKEETSKAAQEVIPFWAALMEELTDVQIGSNWKSQGVDAWTKLMEWSRRFIVDPAATWLLLVSAFASTVGSAWRLQPGF